jgi:hypothetical protein
MDLDERLTQLDTAAEHIGRAYDILHELGYTGLGNALLELLDEVGCEMGDIEEELDETL